MTVDIAAGLSYNINNHNNLAINENKAHLLSNRILILYFDVIL